MKNTRVMVILSLFIVFEVVLTQFLSYTGPTIRISFTFVAMAIAGYLYGWKFGALTALIADLIGMWLYPKGPFFIGFTLAATVAGALYGLLHQRKGKDLMLWVVIVTILNVLINHVIINSLSLAYILNVPVITLMAPRLIKALIDIPLNIIITIPVITFVERNLLRFKL